VHAGHAGHIVHAGHVRQIVHVMARMRIVASVLAGCRVPGMKAGTAIIVGLSGHLSLQAKERIMSGLHIVHG
jgi:hypothetical protein